MGKSEFYDETFISAAFSIYQVMSFLTFGTFYFFQIPMKFNNNFYFFAWDRMFFLLFVRGFLLERNEDRENGSKTLLLDSSKLLNNEKYPHPNGWTIKFSSLSSGTLIPFCLCVKIIW